MNLNGDPDRILFIYCIYKKNEEMQRIFGRLELPNDYVCGQFDFDDFSQKLIFIEAAELSREGEFVKYTNNLCVDPENGCDIRCLLLLENILISTLDSGSIPHQVKNVNALMNRIPL